LPEYEAQVNRFGIWETQLKNHTRCVALSADRTRFLVTIVDEAWCYEVEAGKPIRGLRFPSKESWSAVATERSGRSGVSSEIYAALDLMELKLPVSPEEVTRQDKTLAKQWHPDKNQQLPEFTRKFQDLNAAIEMLTGMDLSRLSRSEIETSSYEQMLHRVTGPLKNGQSVTFTMSLQVGGSLGTDWIYAATFA
jgi:DnaJ-like protein